MVLIKRRLIGGDIPVDYESITSLKHSAFIKENGSLVIEKATRQDAGYYLCQASNGIDSGLSKVVSLKVKGKILRNSDHYCSSTIWTFIIIHPIREFNEVYNSLSSFLIYNNSKTILTKSLLKVFTFSSASVGLF